MNGECALKVGGRRERKEKRARKRMREGEEEKKCPTVIQESCKNDQEGQLTSALFHQSWFARSASFALTSSVNWLNLSPVKINE